MHSLTNTSSWQKEGNLEKGEISFPMQYDASKKANTTLSCVLFVTTITFPFFSLQNAKLKLNSCVPLTWYGFEMYKF